MPRKTTIGMLALRNQHPNALCVLSGLLALWGQNKDRQQPARLPGQDHITLTVRCQGLEWVPWSERAELAWVTAW
jgi:hypothetical protein